VLLPLAVAALVNGFVRLLRHIDASSAR